MLFRSSASCPHRLLLLAMMIASAGVACSTTRTGAIATDATAPVPAYSGLSERTAKSIDAIEQEILKEDAEIEQAASPRRPRIPLEFNERVARWIDYFTGRGRKQFEDFLSRGGQYQRLVQEILTGHGIPKDLYYLAMIESGYVTHALSRAKAAGPWQFIPATGARYGLRRNRYIDERRDIIQSTHAAARYLKDLHSMFQSWYLAMAAYNAGEGRILRATKQGMSHDFWTLAEKKVLPKETRNYVPKFIAAAIIGRHPERYGFEPAMERPMPELERVLVPAGTRLSSLSRACQIPLTLLTQLNPHLIRRMTPPLHHGYAVWLPRGTTPSNLIAKLASHRSRPTHRIHRVRRGEALSTIARRYEISITEIVRTNRLRSKRVYAGQRLRIRLRDS